MRTPVHGGRRRRLTYANVMSSIAAFLALGGTATAATVVITGRDVKDGSLTGADVRDRSLTGRDVKDHSITARDLKGDWGVAAGPGASRARRGSEAARARPGVRVP